jgi:hypothetical protein
MANKRNKIEKENQKEKKTQILCLHVGDRRLKGKKIQILVNTEEKKRVEEIDKLNPNTNHRK